MVAEQLSVAAGDPISFGDLPINGHAIELRINAEDPGNDFRPSPGTVTEYREPGGPGIRVDSWIVPGTVVSQYYDNLMAKLVVWGRTRTEAIARAKRALEEYRVAGVATTIPSHRAVLSHPTFLAGEAHTRFVEDELNLGPEPFDRGEALPSEQATARKAMTVEVGGRRFDVTYWVPEVSTRAAGDRPARKPPTRTTGTAPLSGEPGMVVSPMQGTIVKVSVKAGDRVNADQQICVLEAMKMENEITSPIDGRTHRTQSAARRHRA